MANPTRYVPGYSYTDYQESNPDDPLPGRGVDDDLEIALALFVEDIQPDRSFLVHEPGHVQGDRMDPEGRRQVKAGHLRPPRPAP